MRDVMEVFAGHEHDNDYLGLNRGIALAKRRVTSTDTYGEIQRGGRVVILYKNCRTFDTYIRTPQGVEQMFHYGTR